MKNVIVVATHKDYPMPADPLYLPVQAGRALGAPLPYVGDDSGENISGKNRSFCELTCLYWAWKNLTGADAVGLCHYRRYLAGKRGGKGFDRILTGAEADALLQTVPVLLPKKRNYFIETGYSQYVHAHHEEDLLETRKILEERCPEYVAAFDRTLSRTKGHRFNMFVMRRDLLERYCTWLFGVLFELEKRLDISAYSDYDKRVFGFVAERLLDVWLETCKIPYRELPVLHLESQHWVKKGTAFLKRKFRGRK
jgi:hypothetical protein